MRRLGVDPGSRRTGLSLAESGLSVACPLKTLAHRTPAEALALLCALIAEEGIEEVVIGLPLRLDGTDGEAARRARRLAEQVQTRAAVPVVLWDERLSTVAAERALRDQGVRGRAQRQVVDQAAATILLQSYLDAQHGSAQGESYGDDGDRDDDGFGAGGPALPEAPAPRSGRRRGRGKRR